MAQYGRIPAIFSLPMIRLNENFAAARMSKGWCIGDDAFRQDMVREAERRGVNLHRERFEESPAANCWPSDSGHGRKSCEISLKRPTSI